MTQIERVRDLCKKQGVKLSKMEKDLGFGNGYFNPKNAKSISSDRALQIAQYLGVSVEYLLTGEEKKEPAGEGGQEDPELEEIMALAAQVSPQARAMVLASLRAAAAAQEAAAQGGR